MMSFPHRSKWLTRAIYSCLKDSMPKLDTVPAMLLEVHVASMLGDFQRLSPAIFY
jgi:hypothetical protein